MAARRIYLDNAATTPLDERVLEAMLPFMREKFGNPSSIHSYGRETRAAIEKSRKIIASLLGAATAEIFFTSCGTESANMVLWGAVHHLGIQHLITSAIEHHCVLHCAEALEQAGKIKVHYVALDRQGNVQLDSLERLLAQLPYPTLTVLMHGNNEIGNILDIQQVGEICRRYQSYFFTDTVQTLAHSRFDLQKMKIDFLSGSAHKFHGPKGVGLIYINNRVKLSPLLHGGSQERNMRSGTENVYGIVGMAKALEIAYEELDKNEQYLYQLKQYFWEQLRCEIPGVCINGNFGEASLHTILNVSFPGSDSSDYLLFNLDIEGIAVSAGSACSSGTNVGSHVLRVLEVPPHRPSLRFSFSRFNTLEELDYVVRVLKSLVSTSVQ